MKYRDMDSFRFLSFLSDEIQISLANWFENVFERCKVVEGYHVAGWISARMIYDYSLSVQVLLEIKWQGIKTLKLSKVHFNMTLGGKIRLVYYCHNDPVVAEAYGALLSNDVK